MGGTNSDGASVMLLPECACYIGFQVQDTISAGDHLVTLCRVVSIGRWDSRAQKIVQVLTDNDKLQFPYNFNALDPSSVLYTGQLREEGII